MECEMPAMDDTANGFGGDPDGGAGHEQNFDPGRDAFEFSMSVIVLGVRGLVGDADGEQGEDGGEEVDAGMGGFAEHTE